MKIRIDMTGERFGRLVAAAFSHCDGSGHANWLFACDCGAEVVAKGTNVRRGNTTSCGCLHREISAARLTKHGHRARGHHGPAYRAWQIMNDACSNPRSPKYARCGGQGVRVCEAWRTDFEAFVRDMGERPPRTKLARANADTGFSESNCFWAPLPLRTSIRQPPAPIEKLLAKSANSLVQPTGPMQP